MSVRHVNSIIFVILFTFVFGISVSFAASSDKGANHLLWKVTSKTNTLYIVGSIHLLKKETYPLNDVFEAAFSKTKKLVLEVDPIEMDQPATQNLTIEKALCPNRKNLQNSISKETFALTQKTAAVLGMDINSLNQFKPWFVAITLTTLQLKKFGFNPEYGIDAYFYRKAQQKDKPVISLESAAFQINLFADMSLKTQEQLLQQALEDMSILEHDFTKLINAWEIGDTKELEKILLDSFKGYPEIFKTIIVDRNKSWAVKLTEFLQQDEPHLVVVGAGHLLGEYGLISLLRKKGFAIDQL